MEQRQHALVDEFFVVNNVLQVTPDKLIFWLVRIATQVVEYELSFKYFFFLANQLFFQQHYFLNHFKRFEPLLFIFLRSP